MLYKDFGGFRQPNCAEIAGTEGGGIIPENFIFV